jgi:hypothetical protein
MKKLIRLTESDLHRIIKESVKRVIKEDQQFPIDPSDLARELLNNGIDLSLFVHRLEKTYEILQADNQPSDPSLALVQAIKNSSDLADASEENYEEYDAPLSSPYGRYGIIRIGCRIRQGNEIEFFGYDNEYDCIDPLELNDNEIKEIIRLIR